MTPTSPLPEPPGIALSHEQPSLDELLQFAAVDPVLIRNQEGVEFILEAADAFDREVAALSRSERLMSFLAGRSEEPGGTTLEEVDQRVLRAEQAAEDNP
ncbi:MAG TPA: hypothetical protein VFF52_23835 [Isosphaeraceae bacterium]|nr:hypothetical protein [Isosphaeraceae bacterium]